MVTLRPAEESDSRALWTWRNDPVTRRSSSHRDEVSWEDHCRWFEGVRGDAQRSVLIAVTEAGERVGMVRFDADPRGGAVISINIAPEWRGQGAGRSVLRAALEWHALIDPGRRVLALIRTENEASVRLFAGEGFIEVERGTGFVTMRAPQTPQA